MKYFRHTIEGQIEKLKDRDPKQPYINLVNVQTTAAKALSNDNIWKYKELEIKAVYFRVDKLELSEDLALRIDEAAKFDIREILILTHADSALTSDAFKEFLKCYEISINLQIATFTDEYLEKIGSQEFGSRDLLAFDNLLEYKFIYPDGVALPMLNNAETDRLIEENYQAKRDFGMKSFEYHPPKYITESKNAPTSTQAIETPTYEVTLQVQVQASVDAQQEVSIDQAQLRDSIPIDEKKINEQAGERTRELFSESAIQACPDNVFSLLAFLSSANGHLHFDGIKKISKRALKFILDHQDIYDDFIAGYLPPGFAIDKKTDTLFLSDKQNNQEQANDLHFSKHIRHKIVSPIQYSWLEHARFGTRTLGEFAWSVGKFEHKNTLIDTPVSLCYSGFDHKYHHDLRISPTKPLEGIFPGLEFMSSLSEAGEQNLREIWKRLEERGIHEIATKILAGNRQNYNAATSEDLQNLFGHTCGRTRTLKLETDLKLIIWQEISRYIPSNLNLEARFVEDIFEKFTKAYDKFEESKDHGWAALGEQLDVVGIKDWILKILTEGRKPHDENRFLLEEEMQDFFEKVFTKILPSTETQDPKLKFFHDIFNHLPAGYKFGEHFIDDIFEGLSGAYDQFEELLLKDGIKKGSARFEALLSKWRTLLSEQLQSVHDHNMSEESKVKFRYMRDILNVPWKTTFIQALKSFKIISDNGGSIDELFKYLNQGANPTRALPKVEQYNLRVVHSSIEPNECDSAKDTIPRPKLSITADAVCDFNQALLYLAKLSSDKRASMDSWKIYTGDWKEHHSTGASAAVYLLDKREAQMERAWWGWGRDKPMPPDLDKEAKKKVVAQREKEARAAFDKEAEKYSDTKYFYVPAISVQTSDHNLFEGFTRPHLNLPLLSLAMMHSSGNYYDAAHPMQDVRQWIAVVNKLFEPFKVKTPIEGWIQEYRFKYDYNDNTAKVYENKRRETPRNKYIKALEKQHELAVASFLNIAKGFGFSFGEAMLLGMIAFFDPDKATSAIDYAKGLKAQYGKTLYHAMRTVFLASSGDEDAGMLRSIYYKVRSAFSSSPNYAATGQALSADALKLRLSNLFDYLEFLHKSTEEHQSVHEALTKNGAKPENLVLFAGYHSHLRYKDLSPNSVENFQGKVSDAKKADKFYSLLQSLPILIAEENAFLKPLVREEGIDFETFEPLANAHRQEVEFQSRFNALSGERTDETSTPDFAEVEEQYKIVLKFYGKKYAEIRSGLVSDPQYLEKNTRFSKESLIKSKTIQDPKAAGEFFKDIVSALLAVFTREDNELFHKDFIELAFDPLRSIHEQLNALEAGKNVFERILLSCSKSDRMELVQTLKKASVPPHFIRDLLVFLKSVSEDLLHEAMTLLDFVKLVPLSMYQNPSFLKVVTDFALKNKIPLTELYAEFGPLALVPNIEAFAKKMLQHCEKISSYKPLDVFKAIDPLDKHAFDKYEWVMRLELDEVEALIANQHLNLKQIFRLQNLSKLRVFKDIALRFGEQLSSLQYQELLSFFHSHDLNAARLVRSSLKTISDPKLVFEHFNSLEKLQEIVANKDSKRFEYDDGVVRNKLKGIKEIRTDKLLTDDEQNLLFEEFEQVIQRAKKYSEYDYNQLRMEALRLKHYKRMAKNDSFEKKHELDKDFLSLIAEVLYRETGLFPRYHQIFAVLMKMANSDNLIEEAGTGEGKSIISALLAAYFWYDSKKVDMHTSNRILATDGLKMFASFYEALGIKYAPQIITPDSQLKDYMDAEIVHSTPADLALFLSQILFSSTPEQKEDIFAALGAVYAIIDEGDDLLKSFVTFKLGVALFSMNHDELSVFLGSIIDFSKTQWNKPELSLEDRAENLRMFLLDKIQQQGIHFPLSPSDEAKLQADNPQLYMLSKALLEVTSSAMLIQLLSSLEVAKNLMKSHDSEFIIGREIVDGQEVCGIIPVINSIPQPGVVYGKVVHQFLEELLKSEGVCKIFKESMPTGTMSIKSSKNLVDHYIQTGGGVAILTATPGDKDDLYEFCQRNQICTVISLPRYNEDKRKIHEHQTISFDEIVQKALEIAGQDDRPLFVYLSDIAEAKKFHKAFTSSSMFASLDRQTMVCVGSDDDAAECKNIKTIAGKNGAITITTLLYGRGMHCEIENPNGAVLINACTNCTPPEDKQVNGRVGRGDDEGEIYQYCNEDSIGDQPCKEYKKEISNSRRGIRLHDQPVTDILNYPNWEFAYPRDAVAFHDAVTQKWQEVLSGQQVTVENAKSLRAKLVDAISDMRQCSDKMDDLTQYLQRIDTTPGTQSNKTFQEQQETRAEYLTKMKAPTKQDAQEDSVKEFVHIFSWSDNEFLVHDKWLKGEGSYGNKMIEKFKQYFAGFHMAHRHAELDAVRAIVDKFVDIQDLDVNAMQPDQWHPIGIHTEVKTSAGHAETILFNFDKGLLFWVNSGDGGIKIFKIKGSFHELKAAFGELVTPESQVDTRKKIWSLLEYNQENPNPDTEPPHLTIPMEEQSVGNCGWAQSVGIIKAILFMLNVDLTGDFLSSSNRMVSAEYKGTINHTDYVYSSFQSFSKAAFLEEAICLMDEQLCKPELLGPQEVLRIKKQGQDWGHNIIVYPLLVELSKASVQLCEANNGKIYERSACASSKSLAILAKFATEMGKALQKTTGDAKALLEQCYDRGNLEELSQYYTEISLNQRIADKEGVFSKTANLACQVGADDNQIMHYITAAMQCSGSGRAEAEHESCI